MSDLKKVSGFEQKVDLDGAVTALNNKPTKRYFNVLDKTNESPLVDVNFLFYTGSAADPQGKKGLAALTANMISQGSSESRSYKEIKKAMYPLAGAFLLN